MQGLVPVDFHGDRVPSWQDDDGHVYVLISPLCRNLGVNPNNQRTKLKKILLFQRHLKWCDSISVTGTHEALALDINYLPAWLANISLERVKSSSQPKLLLYQEECAQVLREYSFGSGMVVNPRKLNVATLEAQEYAARYLESAVRIDTQFNRPRHLTLQESVKAIREETGLDLSDRLKDSPYCDDLHVEELFLEPQDLSDRFRLPRSLLNSWLSQHGLQESQPDKSYTMTRKAEALGVATRHSWSTKPKEGYNLKWQMRFIGEHLADIRRFGEILA
jgi:hypothetical protein